MRFNTPPHPLYCGIALHARTMYGYILDQAGATRLHRHMPATPEARRNAMAPYRAQIVLAAACLLPWYWLADLWANHGIPLVLGHALSMNAIHGGKATNDTIDSQKIAALLRGGMLPQAYVYPAERRATRDLLRRRMPLARKRGALLAHVHNTNSQYTLPAIGNKMADKANRDGVAERCADPAVPKSLAVDRASLPTTTSCSVMANAPSSQPPSIMTPRPSLCGKRSPGSARSSAACCSTRCMISSASRGGRIVPPPVVSSSVPENLLAHAPAPPAAQAVMLLSRGPLPKPPCSACGRVPPRKPGSPAWRKNTARATP